MRRFHEDIPGPDETSAPKRWELSEKTKDRLAGCVATLICLVVFGLFVMLPRSIPLVSHIGYLIEDIQRFFGW